MLRKIRNSAAEFIQKQINQYWYSQSIGTIFRHRLKSELDRNRFRINEALEILDKVSIDQEIDNKLPYFYKQLFIRKQYYLSELWTGQGGRGNLTKPKRQYGVTDPGSWEAY